MLEIKNTEVWISGVVRSIIASGIPMTVGEINTKAPDAYEFMADDSLQEITSTDPLPQLKGTTRARKLGSAPVGSAHDHFLVGCHVQFDIKYPQYWTIEAERYHNFEIISSQSKMHKLTMMGKNWEEFKGMFNQYVELSTMERVYSLIQMYNDTDGVKYPEIKYTLFMRALSNLPMGFEMWMACDLTYLQIKTMYFQRCNHKLKEDWKPFCDWALELPYFAQLIGVTK
jgi:hypothetical protein